MGGWRYPQEYNSLSHTQYVDRPTHDEPAKEGLKGRGTASRANIHSQSPSKATSTSPNPRVSPRTPQNPASRLPTKPTPSAGISPPKRPQIQPREPARVHKSVTRDATKPGMTSGKATPESSRTRTLLPAEPIHVASSSPKSRTPRSDTIAPASSPSAKPSSSVAHISRPRPAPNAGSRSGTEGNARTPGTHNTANAPSKEVQQRRGCRERPRLAEADKSTSDLRPPRTPQNSASHLPSKSTPSASISPPKRPQIQPQESTRIQRSVTKNAANPGMTSGKATPGPSRTRTPLPSEPIRIGSSSPKLRTPQNAKATPSSNPSAAASSSIARPRPTPNAGSRSGIEGNAKTPGTHNTVKAPSKGVQQRRGCKERSRLAEADESTSDLRPPQEAECDGSMEKLESDGVGDVVRGKRPCMLNEMGGAAVQTDELKDENRRLREKIERLKEMAENRRLKEELERLKETLGVGTSSLGSDGVV
ncbi:hypothetical protein V5O48_015858 [Marasmius crinis-equi]|uniref:Uncharacterized protein n=1 Tax=Marasmius crinis-equi TaxID=585013 RepID=A0ABR3ETF4_9AGAR